MAGCCNWVAGASLSGALAGVLAGSSVVAAGLVWLLLSGWFGVEFRCGVELQKCAGGRLVPGFSLRRVLRLGASITCRGLTA